MAIPLNAKIVLAPWTLGFIVLMSLTAALGVRHESGWYGYLHLTRAGAITQGLITSGSDPNNHCRITYSFVVASHPYSGSDDMCGFQPGQSLRVTYLLSNPSYSCAGDARERYPGELVATVMACFCASGMLLLMFWWQFRSWST